VKLVWLDDEDDPVPVGPTETVELLLCELVTEPVPVGPMETVELLLYEVDTESVPVGPTGVVVFALCEIGPDGETLEVDVEPVAVALPVVMGAE